MAFQAISIKLLSYRDMDIKWKYEKLLSTNICFWKKIIFVENFKVKTMNIMQRFCLWRISDLLPIKSYVTKGLSLQIPELS